jgi:hypothetical protein
MLKEIYKDGGIMSKIIEVAKHILEDAKKANTEFSRYALQDGKLVYELGGLNKEFDIKNDKDEIELWDEAIEILLDEGFIEKLSWHNAIENDSKYRITEEGFEEINSKYEVLNELETDF